MTDFDFDELDKAVSTAMNKPTTLSSNPSVSGATTAPSLSSPVSSLPQPSAPADHFVVPPSTPSPSLSEVDNTAPSSTPDAPPETYVPEPIPDPPKYPSHDGQPAEELDELSDEQTPHLITLPSVQESRPPVHVEPRSAPPAIDTATTTTPEAQPSRLLEEDEQPAATPRHPLPSFDDSDDHHEVLRSIGASSTPVVADGPTKPAPDSTDPNMVDDTPVMSHRATDSSAQPSVVGDEVIPMAAQTFVAPVRQSLRRQAAEQPDASPESPAPSPAVRRTGRFMEFKPTSDESDAPTVRPQPVAAKSSAPLVMDIVPNPSNTLASADVASTEQPQDAVERVTPPGASQWPDPLDVAAQSADGTPFLPDAHIDKRPLSAFAASDIETDTAAGGTEHPAESPILVVDDTSSTPTPEALKAVTPEATHFDDTQPHVFNFDREDPSPNWSFDAETASPAVSDTLVSPPDQAGTALHTTPDPAESLAPSVAPVHPTVLAAPAAAPPIFDTQSYHQPLPAHATSHQSHLWAWIGLAVGLLVIGGVIGYVLYSMNI